ncbi:MAG: DUF1893 domain-containing protein [Eubacteriales bacterium]|nr:DUF1893 domain-containing protein [Eubacteriales bacterium]
MSNLEYAIQQFRENDLTCAIYNGEQLCSSTERGVKPLLGFISDGLNFSGFSAADRVVGKAAAFLYVRLGVSEVFADVMSRSAVNVFKEHGIVCTAGELTEVIVNRAKTGLCPMESAVWDISDPVIAEEAIRAKLKEMYG